MTIQEQNQVLTQWVIEKIKREYPDDVSLLISCNDLRMPEDQGHQLFDYYVPETERGYQLARTFIVAGKGYDLYPRPWERIAQMAVYDDYNSTCLDRAEIIYARSEQDRKRFEAFQQQFRDNLKSPDFTYRKALEKLQAAMEIYQTMMFEQSPSRVQMAVGYIADYLATAVACANGRYFKASQVYQTEELSEMEALPEGFLADYEKIFWEKDPAAAQKLAHSMIAATRRFLAARKPASPRPQPDFGQLASWYQELIYTWRRIDLAAAEKDYKRARAWGCFLQQELDTVCAEFGLPQMELMDCYDAGDLIPLQQRARVLEQEILKVLDEHGVMLDQYDSAEDFLRRNP